MALFSVTLAQLADAYGSATTPVLMAVIAGSK